MKYKYNETDLRDKIKQSRSMAQLLSSYGIKITGGNYTTMRRYIKVYNIDISHWGKTIKERQGWLKGKTHNWAPKIPLEKINKMFC